MRKWSVFIVGMLTLSLIVILVACGGGDKGSPSVSAGPDATLTSASASQVGDTVTQAVKLVAPAAALGNLKSSSISPEQQPPLVSILDTVLSAYRYSAQGKHISALYTSKENCTNGGTITVNVTSVDLLKKLIHADIDVSACTVGTQTLNGTMGVDYIVGSINIPPTLENLKNFEKVTITTSGFTYANTANNDNLIFTGLTLVLQDFTYNGDAPAHGSITLGGLVTGTIDGEAINIEGDSLGLVFSANPTGVTVSLSGRIRASCLGGWVTIATNQPVFTPANAHCPTAGQILVSSGGNSVSVAIGADSRITISFNGNPVQTYNNCNEVKGFCKG
jgi:hypothetical protein